MPNGLLFHALLFKHCASTVHSLFPVGRVDQTAIHCNSPLVFVGGYVNL